MLIESPTMPPRLLPLKEPKSEPLRKRRWWQRKHSDAEILRRAIGVLDERGWTRGVWIDRDGSVCLLGAVGVAAVEAGRKHRYYEAIGARHVDQVVLQADSLLGFETCGKAHVFNDSRARDVSHVKRALAVLAARAEANGGKFPRA